MQKAGGNTGFLLWANGISVRGLLSFLDGFLEIILYKKQKQL